MLIIHNRFIPFRNFYAINILGMVFVRKGTQLSKYECNHEFIHTLQQRELLYVGFYLWYIAEWLLLLTIHRDRMKAYRSISFEREAYTHMHDLDYSRHRKHFAFLNLH